MNLGGFMNLCITDSSCLWEYFSEEFIISITNLCSFIYYFVLLCLCVFQNAFQFKQLLGEWKFDIIY